MQNILFFFEVIAEPYLVMFTRQIVFTWSKSILNVHLFSLYVCQGAFSRRSFIQWQKILFKTFFLTTTHFAFLAKTKLVLTAYSKCLPFLVC